MIEAPLSSHPAQGPGDSADCRMPAEGPQSSAEGCNKSLRIHFLSSVFWGRKRSLIFSTTLKCQGTGGLVAHHIAALGLQ